MTTLSINNNVARYCATKGIVKILSKEAARNVWNALRREGWDKDGLVLTNHSEEGTQRFFTFTILSKESNKVSISYLEMEVAPWKE